MKKKRPKKKSHSPFGVPTLPRYAELNELEGDIITGENYSVSPTPVVEEPNLPVSGPAPPSPKHEKLVANRYEILSQIGTGGMGEVFKVRHLELGKTFALKLLLSEMSENPRMREMFYSEARLASSLEHRHIVSITDFGEDPRRGAFIVMEYLQGENLAERLEKSRSLDVKTSCDIIQQTADALQFMHSSGVVHGDIKPENIFLTPGTTRADRRRNLVKVLDFGLSRLSMSQKKQEQERITGTPAYLAPERICGAPPDEKSDLYSLGVLFYEVLTGEVPFDGDVTQILNSHLSTPPAPPSSFRKEKRFEGALDALILKALSKEPGHRHRNVGSFAQALNDEMFRKGIARRRRLTPVPYPASRPGDATCRNIVEANPLPLFAASADGTILLANQSFALFVKEEVTGLVGQNLFETRLGKFAPGLREDLSHVISFNKVTSRELEFTKKRENNNMVLVWLAPLVLGGVLEGVHGVVHWVKR